MQDHDCVTCDVESQCHYPFKPTACVHQRKFWDAQRRKEYDEAVISRAAADRIGVKS